MKGSLWGTLALGGVLLMGCVGRVGAQLPYAHGPLTGSLVSYSFTAERHFPWSSPPADPDSEERQNEWMLLLLFGGALVGLMSGGGCPCVPEPEHPVVSESAHVATVAGLAVAGLLFGWRRKRS
ncbi:MAG TPA: hypothetical protein VLH79_16620 [Chthonomonadales bacterium]|nr:hypothetical protein [Chthonomonadales bacterium]